MMYTHEIRASFVNKLVGKDFVTDKSGVKMLEIVGASFIPTDDTIFGSVSYDYVNREIDWYKSQSLNVFDIPGGPPAIWKQVCDKDGFINSNYGWCIYSQENGSQYKNVLNELMINPESRRAIMIYTRPMMWEDYDKNGRSDFMCTNAVQYVIRDNKVSAIVQMRSNDAIFGFKNDYAWQKYVLSTLVENLNELTGSEYEVGSIVWQAGSLHIYERHFYLVDNFLLTGQTTISKEDYDKIHLR